MLDLSGLEELRVTDLLAPASGRPLELPLTAIEFDPEQPRKHFDEAKLEELAQTIRACGVIQPISVHMHPSDRQRYVVNVGERRVRASRLAGRSTIPAYVEAPLDGYARVIENLAREELSPFDLAQFIVDREDAGEPRARIAKRLAKAPSFITELAELAAAPASVRAIHASGRCADVRTLYLLCRLYRVNPAAVETLAQTAATINRSQIEAMTREQLVSHSEQNAGRRRRPPAANGFLIEVAGRPAFMALSTRPSMTTATVSFADGETETVELGRVRLIQWTTLP